ncbi:hypothetical protein [Paraflavitalea sp. CAU 1676]|uniref:hypothetical protein n=1 Tax=Paraflavitalea sp. CAU 1676 TaxID=3032598 RepID=UPI0023DA414A|nr:hypothetical protein [Paraflavitalea sp. CAU 1676]MDF2189980.1 hypothetical protein [Paraflavitalea sp. CAU 1676]
MARLTSIPPFVGTVGPITVYLMYDRYYLRTRSSITGKRIKKDPAFRKFRASSGQMALASPLAASVYALIPEHRRKKNQFRILVSEARIWLKYGWEREDIFDYLSKQYAGRRGVMKEYPCTNLRISYRAQCASLCEEVVGFGKKDLAELPPVELRLWQKRDREFRRKNREVDSQHHGLFTPKHPI